MTNNPVEYAKDDYFVTKFNTNSYNTLKSKSDSWESIYQGYDSIETNTYLSGNNFASDRGVYVNRSLMSDENQNPYKVVPYKLQKESINILSEYYFDSDKFYLPANVVNKMQRERRSFDFFGKTEDPNT